MPTDHREIAFETAINKLREYRSVLIPAVVTGKIDMRNTTSSRHALAER